MSILARFRRRKPLSRKILARAADIIEENGWIRFRSYNDNGYCALGAINRAYTELHADEADRLEAAVMFAETVGYPRYANYSPSWAIPYWNDNEAGSIDEVVSMFRKAAK